MKERDTRRIRYRPYLVCYNEHRCISNLTKAEMEQLILDGQVDWLAHQGQRLDQFELDFFKTYLEIKREKESMTPNSFELAKKMSQFSPEPISRITIAKTRKSIAKKLGFKRGW